MNINQLIVKRILKKKISKGYHSCLGWVENSQGNVDLYFDKEWKPIPNFSNDLNIAWKLIESLRNQNHKLGKTTLDLKENSNCVKIVNKNNKKVIKVEMEDDLPTTICYAALIYSDINNKKISNALKEKKDV